MRERRKTGVVFWIKTQKACVVRVCAPTLTVHGHAHRDALLETTQLRLVACDLVDDAAAIVLAGVGRVEVLLDGATEETLKTHRIINYINYKHTEELRILEVQIATWTIQAGVLCNGQLDKDGVMVESDSFHG